jgi:hypothetical protein
LTRSSLLVAPPVFPRSRSFSATSSVARSSRRASTPTRLLPTVPPSRPVSSPERPPPLKLPTSFFSMLFPFPSVSPWRATSSPPLFPVDRPFPQVKSPHFFLLPPPVFLSWCHSSLCHSRMLHHMFLHNIFLSFQRPHRDILVGVWSRKCLRYREPLCLPIQSNCASEHSRIPHSLPPHHPRILQRTPGY